MSDLQLPTSENLTPIHVGVRRFGRRYWLRIVRLLTVAILFVGILLPLLAGAIPTYVILHGNCHDDGVRPDDYGHHWEAVTIDADAGGKFNAYFVAGTNGATIIIPPAHRGGLNNRQEEADVLIRNGYSVLGFESRRCADMGALSLGYKEVSEVGDALEYLRTRPDVNAGKIGLLGFSSAGATSIMAAAQYPEIKALVAEGGYADMGGLVDGDAKLRYPETLIRLSIRLTYRVVTGIDIDKLSPKDAINNIHPRPILLIYGTAEPSLPGAYEQQKAAGDNAELWVVNGADHGGYLRTEPDEYERRVIEFFNRTLLRS